MPMITTGPVSRIRHTPLWRHRLRQTATEIADSQGALLVGFTLLALVVTGLGARWPGLIPTSAMVLVMMVGGFWLRMRAFLLLLLVVGSGVAFMSNNRDQPIGLGVLLVLSLGALLVALFVRDREQLGVQGTTGASMLVDLRDRIRAQDNPQRLPDGWHLESAIRSANGESFSGDFVVVADADDTLEIVMVDISGKGRHAGTRALMLSAAFGGLLGAMPPAAFLPSANQYLLRQNWPEGFATAVHVAVDFSTGQYAVRNAGHPAVAHYHAGSGEWELLGAFGGPALGLVDHADFAVTRRHMRSGDALMLYTDGMVETPGRDLDMGVDRLVGRASGLVAAGTFARGADLIVDTITAQDDDDRTLLLLWRDGR